MLLVLSPKSIFRYLGGTFLAHAEFAFFVSLGIHSISRVRDLSPFVLASRLDFPPGLGTNKINSLFSKRKKFLIMVIHLWRRRRKSTQNRKPPHSNMPDREKWRKTSTC